MDIAKRAAEVRLQVALLDHEAEGVSRPDVTALVESYAAEVASSGRVPQVLRDELTRWIARFSLTEDPPAEPSGSIFGDSPHIHVMRALWRRQDALRAAAKKEPRRRQELLDHLDAEYEAVQAANRMVNPTQTVDSDDDDGCPDDLDSDLDEEMSDPVPPELNIGRRGGPTVSGGLPGLGRRR